MSTVAGIVSPTYAQTSAVGGFSLVDLIIPDSSKGQKWTWWRITLVVIVALFGASILLSMIAGLVAAAKDGSLGRM